MANSVLLDIEEAEEHSSGELEKEKMKSGS